ncbi:MAG TPA: bifunctional acetate--CoA ligase family protein/GNAT family N-acetyltransferase [Gemmataceae bacterium]
MPVRRHSLDPIFRPSSVAVVGASGTPGSVGSILFRNLLANPFGGVVYPVNPKRKAVHGVLCYPDMAAVPEPVDLAVIATPAATVPGVVRACVDHGAKSAIIISAGFSELGREGKALEGQVREAAAGRLRILGPNCLGVIHPPHNLNASFAASMARPGKVALLSQSGAICTAILDWADRRNIGFSSFVSVGSMLDVDFADLIDYFGDDPHTSSILIYMESIGDVRSFLSAARAVARQKPVIVVKSGRSEVAARAAASHTGALAGSDAVFDTAFRRAGVLRVSTIRDLFHMAEILDMQPEPPGPNLVILTNAGGPGVMAVDALTQGGGRLAELGPETLEQLNEILPPYWSHANPVDLLGDATPERYRRAVEICARDPHAQGILIMLTPQAMTDPTETARQLVPFARLPGKPVLASWLGGDSVQPGRDILHRAGLPTFDTPETAVRAFLHLVQYRENQQLLYEAPPALPEDWRPDTRRARAVIDAARAEGRLLLTEDEAKTLLAAYDIPVTPTARAATEEEAVAAAAKVGYPVVLKLLSPVITHKSDAGGVRLSLPDAAAVREAFGSIRERAEEYAAAHGIERGQVFAGVTVQPMVRARGYELIVGSSLDRQFGPVILFGAGGVLVEVFRDRALGLPPLTRTLARRLMERTKIAEALKGVRGQKPVPPDQLEMLLVRFSQMVADLPEVEEFDINPLLASPEGVIALDARGVLAEPGSPAPKLAIHPYPNQYTTTWKLPPAPGEAEGAEVTVRVLRPEDEALIVELFETFSEQTIRMRFFRMLKRLSRESLIRLCHLDYDREMALAAVRRGDGRPQILGVARYYLDPEANEAEFAVAVGDPWQCRGLGTHLLGRLIDVARDKGIARLVGPVFRDNGPMIRVGRKFGFEVRDTEEPTVVELVLDLKPGGDGGPR